jgi:hypothetical protein
MVSPIHRPCPNRESAKQATSIRCAFVDLSTNAAAAFDGAANAVSLPAPSIGPIQAAPSQVAPKPPTFSFFTNPTQGVQPHAPMQPRPLAAGLPHRGELLPSVKSTLLQPSFNNMAQGPRANLARGSAGDSAATMYTPRMRHTSPQQLPRAIPGPRPPAHPPPPPGRPQMARFAQSGSRGTFSQPAYGSLTQEHGRGSPGRGRGRGWGSRGSKGPHGVSSAAIEATPDMWTDPWQTFRAMYPDCEW